MTSLSSVFTELKLDQCDMLENLPTWYTDNYDVFRGRLQEVKLSETTARFTSKSQKDITMTWWTPNCAEPIKVEFEVNAVDDYDLIDRKAIVRDWLITNGQDRTHDSDYSVFVFVDNIDTVIELFNNFA